MKTIKIQIADRFAEQTAILLHSLDIINLLSWSESGFMDDSTIYIICGLTADSDNTRINRELQLEKLKEKRFIKIIN